MGSERFAAPGRSVSQGSVSLLALVLLATATTSAAPVKQTVRNEVKGQGQLAGQNGQFGVVYSLQSGFNFAISSARYTLEPFLGPSFPTAGIDEKLVVLEIAIKNTKSDDNWFGTEGLFTLVDVKGELYNSQSFALESKGSADPNLTLRPGQGLGQADLKDPLRVAFKVPGQARIVKVMLNQGRAGKNGEQVIRYYVAGATKAEAGETGDPKNAIAPLPEEACDPDDPSGAVALEEGKGTTGVYVPSGAFALRLDSFGYSTEPLIDGSAAEEGKRFAVATITAKSLTDQSLTMFEVSGGDFPLYELTDADGERIHPAALRKAKRDETPEHEFKRGDEYTFRVIFTLPADTGATKLVLGAGGARKWAYDVSGVK